MLLRLLLAILYVHNVASHMKFINPVARSDDTGIKDYPCGPDSFWRSNQASTILKPGLFTLKWEEVINHIGAPFRIALSVGDDENYDKWILADHIPHNDQGDGTFEVPKHYIFNITIPDIDCPRCSLQIINLMTDKIEAGKYCSYPEGPGVCFSVYHSCANIKIVGTESPETFEHLNPERWSYTQESDLWVQLPDKSWYIPSAQLYMAPVFLNPLLLPDEVQIDESSSSLPLVFGILSTVVVLPLCYIQRKRRADQQKQLDETL